MDLKPGVDRQKLLDHIYNRAVELEQRYYGCAQCLIASIQDFFPLNGALFKASTSFSGGFASTTEGACGALTGGIMVLSYFFGRSREEFADISKLRRPGPFVRDYWDRFRKEYGGDSCKEVQMHLFGNAYRFLDNLEYIAYEEAGGHKDKCPDVVGRSAVWLAELLLDNNVPAIRRHS